VGVIRKEMKLLLKKLPSVLFWKTNWSN
jgi:hypothetical protein